MNTDTESDIIGKGTPNEESEETDGVRIRDGGERDRGMDTSKSPTQTRGSPEVEGKASIDIGTNNTDGGITNVRGEETVPDAGNVESGRRVGEKDASGKGSNREHIERKIKEILRKQTVERRDNGVDGRGTDREEQKETAEAFEDRDTTKTRSGRSAFATRSEI